MKADEAAEYFRKAISLQPDYVDAHFNLSLVLLLKGYFSEGWKEYEWRFKRKEWLVGNLQKVEAP